jgi:hypothetical protein
MIHKALKSNEDVRAPTMVRPEKGDSHVHQDAVWTARRYRADLDRVLGPRSELRDPRGGRCSECLPRLDDLSSLTMRDIGAGGGCLTRRPSHF